MKPAERDLLRILAVGHDTSMRGEGLSLHAALQRARYAELRKHFAASDLVPLIERNPELVTQWRMYSEDKRTDGGFAFSGEAPTAVADYVVRELDFWSRV